MKKIKGFILALLITAISPSAVFADSPTPAGAGVWDLLLAKSYTVSSSGTNSATVTSGGGDVRVCASGIESGNNVSFQFYSTTKGAIGVVHIIANANASPSEFVCAPKDNIAKYVDSNGKANVYVKMYSNNLSSDTIYLEIQD